VILVDDHYLAAGLAGQVPLAHEGRIATTCAWWWRLSAAVADDRGGALSAYFAQTGPALREAWTRTIAGLPGRITVLDLRDLIPAMALLSAAHGGLNLLTAEAIAAAEVLDAAVVLHVDTPKIREVAESRGISYRAL
jgi:hypothetical protein